MKKNMRLFTIFMFVASFGAMQAMDQKDGEVSAKPEPHSYKSQPYSYKIKFVPILPKMLFSRFLMSFYDDKGKLIKTYEYERQDNSHQKVTVLADGFGRKVFQFNSLSELKAQKDFPLDLEKISEKNDDEFEKAKAKETEYNNSSWCSVQ